MDSSEGHQILIEFGNGIECTLENDAQLSFSALQFCFGFQANELRGGPGGKNTK
jgi:hypothetical protein